MKRIYTITVLTVLGIQLGLAQNVDIPDAAFKNYLVNENCVNIDGDNDYDTDADTNNDGEIQITEALAVLDLLVSDIQITSLDGIESFVNLDKINIFGTSITSFDAVNLPQNLNEFRCSSTPSLNSLDLSNLVSLETLYLRDLGITSLDLSTLSFAENITILDSPLPTLDVSNLTNLEYVTFKGTQAQNLITDGCINLLGLYCFDSNISGLDVSSNTNLEVIRAHNNNIPSLSVSGLSALTELSLYNNDLASIEFGNNNALQSVDMRNNELSSVDISTLINAVFISASENLLTGITIGSNLDELSSLSLANNLLTNLSVSNLDQLSSLSLADNELSAISLQNLPNLSTLIADSNSLTEINLNGLPNVSYIKLNNNLLTEIDFTNQEIPVYAVCDENPNLEALYFKNGEDDFQGVEGERTSFENCPNLNLICVDAVEQSLVQQIINDYGYTGVTLTTECPEVLSVDQELFNAEMFLFPNPATTKLRISGFTNDLMFTIYTISGKKVNEGTYNDSGISIENLTAGLYIITLENWTASTTLQFVKK